MVASLAMLRSKLDMARSRIRRPWKSAHRTFWLPCSHRWVVACLLTMTSLLAQPCLGESPHATPDYRSDVDADRVRGMAEFGFGLLTLPGAAVCVAGNPPTCNRGDTSLMLEAWQLVRPRDNFAAGAGITLGVIPTTDAPPGSLGSVERDHSRAYFTAEMIARYYPVLRERLEGWAGLTGGLVVVSDTFISSSTSVEYSDKAFVGPRGVTIRTEGATLGVALGGAYNFVTQWYAGASFRFGSWFLPKIPGRDAFGDEASLAGRNSMFVIGFNIAYRIAL